MEYVILLACIIPPLLGFSAFFFDPTGQPPLFNPSRDYTGNFGLLGNAFHDWYQRLISGISLPIP